MVRGGPSHGAAVLAESALRRAVLGLSGVTTAVQMRAALTVLLPLVEACLL